MKRLFKLIVSSLCIGISSSALAIEPGQNIPDLTFPTMSGSKIGLAEFKGKIIYIDIWASWCGTCVESLTWMENLQEKFGKNSFQVVTINVDEHPKDAEKIIRETKTSLLVALDPDGATPAAFNAEGVPTSYIIGRDGRVISVHQGLREEDQNEIEIKIAKSIAETS